MGKKGGRRISIPRIEDRSKHNTRFAILNNELNGSPTKVLEKFVDTGFKGDWWTKEGLRESKAFRRLIELTWGKSFLKNLERIRREQEKKGI